MKALTSLVLTLSFVSFSAVAADIKISEKVAEILYEGIAAARRADPNVASWSELPIPDGSTASRRMKVTVDAAMGGLSCIRENSAEMVGNYLLHSSTYSCEVSAAESAEAFEVNEAGSSALIEMLKDLQRQDSVLGGFIGGSGGRYDTGIRENSMFYSLNKSLGKLHCSRTTISQRGKDDVTTDACTAGK